jgi:nucleoside-diphosphate-sugar epimerase
MRVLLTGSEGYIGVLLGPVLLRRGHDVVGLDTGFYRNGWLYNGVDKPPLCMCKDIRRVAVADLEGYDAVIHLGELSNDPLGELSPDTTYEVNHRGSVSLAEKCRQAGVPRFVYSSSCSVYGIGTGDLKTENSDLWPQTAYAKCKALVEHDVSEMADDRFSPVFLRNATAYGPSPRMRFDLVLNNLAGVAWTTGQVRMTSDGTPWRPLAHVLDICQAFACALEAPREAVHNQVFNVGDTRENYQVRDIAEIVAGEFPGCELTVGFRGGDNRSYRVSFEKIRERLPSFRCERNASVGARQLRDLFGLVRLTSEMFEDRAYTRLKQLRHLLATEQIDASLYWRQAPAAAVSSPDARGDPSLG